MALADKFKGKVTQEHYKQPLLKDSIGVYYGVYESQTFEFEGCTYDEAHTSSGVTVTDVGGGSYTFTPIESFTNSSSGSGFFAKEECRVSRTRMSPHMWRLVFTRIGGKLIRNGALQAEGPTWMDRYNQV